MANASELCESIELRLQQVFDEADRLTRALDALGPSGSVGGRALRGAAPAVADSAAPWATGPPDSPPRRAMAARPQQRSEAGVPDAAERAVRALRAELDAGLRTTAGA